jgi:hypothetical protein
LPRNMHGATTHQCDMKAVYLGNVAHQSCYSMSQNFRPLVIPCYQIVSLLNTIKNAFVGNAIHDTITF